MNLAEMKCLMMCKKCRLSQTTSCCTCQFRCQCKVCRFSTCCCERKQFFRRHCRFIKDAIIIYALTFLVLTPAIAFNLRHTPFDFIKHKNVTMENQRMLKENVFRYNQSLLTLKRLVEGSSVGQSKILRNLLEQTPEQRKMPYNNTQGIRKGLAITIITVKRSVEEEKDPHYLTQVVATFLRLLQENERLLNKFHIHFSICDVDDRRNSHDEVGSLPPKITVYTRYQNITQNPGLKVQYVRKPVLYKEKDDYSYCLDRVIETNLSHVLLVEDDALPRDELFIVLNSLIFSSVQHHKSNVTYYKLYHPERLLGYISLEPERIVELLSLGVVISVALSLIYTRCRKKISTPMFIVWLTFYIYSCLVLLSIGRANVVELRRISTYFYQMTPSPSCCTPAMLFTREGGKRISAHLKTVINTPKLPKDFAISNFINRHELITRYIQPNLFKHIGHVSSLRPTLINPYIV